MRTARTGTVTARRTAGGETGTTGAFAEDDWTIGTLVLTGGGRVDRWTIDDGFFRQTTASGTPTITSAYPDRSGTIGTGRVGALLHPAPAIDLRAAAYTGFRVPTLNELYRPFVVFPITTQANATLKLERLKGVEGGVDLHPAAWLSLSLTGFYNRLEDAVANVTIGTNLRQRQNVDAIVDQGGGGVEQHPPRRGVAHRILRVQRQPCPRDRRPGAAGRTRAGTEPAPRRQRDARLGSGARPVAVGYVALCRRAI